MMADSTLDRNYLKIISVNSSLSEKHLNYLLYVPGTKSTCQWTWNEIDGQKSFKTIGEDQNAEHTFMYPKDKSNFSDPKVECLSDDGGVYYGIFPK